MTILKRWYVSYPLSIAARVSAAQSAMQTIDAMAEGVALLKLDGTILSVNPAIEELLGMQKDQLAGQNIGNLFRQFLEGVDLRNARNALETLTKGGIPQLGLITMMSADHKRLQIIPDVALIHTKDGSPPTAVLTLRDVTKLMEATELFERIFDNTHILIAYLDTSFRFVRVNQAFAGSEGQPAGDFTGKSYFELHPRQEDREIFQRVLETGETYEAHEKFLDRPWQPGGRTTYWDWSLQPLKDARGHVDGLLLCLLDVTARKLSQDRDRAVGQLLELFLRKTDRQEYLDAVVCLLRDWTGYHCVGIRTLDSDGHIPYASYLGFSEEFRREENRLSIQNDACVCTRVIGGNHEAQDNPMMTGHGSFICQDLSAFVNALPDEKSKGRYRKACLNSGFSSIAVVPLRYNERIEGAIHLADSSHLHVPKHKVEFVETIAPLIGEAIHRFAVEEETRHYQERLRLLSKRLATAEEEERWRISRYIHDTIIQNLSLSSVRLGSMIGSFAEGKLAEEADKLRKTRSLIDKAIDESRMVMADLTPALLYELGLVPALRELAGRLEETHGVGVTVEDDGRETCMNNALRGLLFESVRELAVNALKHAGKCDISISVVHGDDIVIRVADAGRGYDPALVSNRPGKHGGFGLFSVRQRLESFGGRLDVRSAPGSGTVAAIIMPAKAGQD